MKVLMLNGSRREKGCTFTALSEVAKGLGEAGIETEILHVGRDAVSGNIDNIVKDIRDRLKNADGLVVGSPVYFAGASGEITAILDRLFMLAEADLRLKPAAAIASARRAGTTATLDALNKYFTYAEMPIVSSRYWNMVHGAKPEDVKADEEGVQIMRILGRNMAWLLKSIEAGKKAGVEQPRADKKVFTNFVR
ncbi:MAG: flavodoxin family protein [Selenomonadaceae bacterium]|nr:flavodoxin family protein [Selenomonadaceae bacterium]MBR6906219.1 flavodoxin family protein [Selenomonadaceae bacterium]